MFSLRDRHPLEGIEKSPLELCQLEPWWRGSPHQNWQGCHLLPIQCCRPCSRTQLSCSQNCLYSQPGGPECELVPWPVCMSETRWLKRWVGVGCPPCGVHMILCYVYTQITISTSIFFHYKLGRVYWTILCCNHYLVLLLFALQLCLYLVTFHFSTFTRIITDY